MTGRSFTVNGWIRPALALASPPEAPYLRPDNEELTDRLRAAEAALAPACRMPCLPGEGEPCPGCAAADAEPEGDRDTMPDSVPFAEMAVTCG